MALLMCQEKDVPGELAFAATGLGEARGPAPTERRNSIYRMVYIYI